MIINKYPECWYCNKPATCSIELYGNAANKVLLCEEHENNLKNYEINVYGVLLHKFDKVTF